MFVSTWLLASALLFLLAVRRQEVTVSSLLVALIFGAVFSAPFSYLFVRAMEPLQGGAEVHATRVVQLPGRLDQAFSLCLAAVNQMAGSRVRRADAVSGSIEATIPGSLGSAGSTIEIRMVERPQAMEVTVTSRPSRPFLLYDFGRNEGVVSQLVAAIRSPRE
jgi:hypothetical protein